MDVDDLKVSHADAEEVKNMIDWLKSIYRDNMRVSRRKTHGYLGMDLGLVCPNLTIAYGALLLPES
jgi:hypothetical protein